MRFGRIGLCVVLHATVAGAQEPPASQPTEEPPPEEPPPAPLYPTFPPGMMPGMMPMPSPFTLRVDVIGGYGFSDASIEIAGSESKTGIHKGPLAGLNLTIGTPGLSFTTGATYSSKGFTRDTGADVRTDYLIIPLLYPLSYTIDRTMLELQLGVYLGILLSSTEEDLYKSIDFGLTGSAQLTYMFSSHAGALVGVKLEYGGLNNLSEDELVTSLRTKHIFPYLGIRFSL